MASQKHPLLAEFFEYISSGMVSMIGVAIFILADTFFIANGIGQEAVAALNVAIPIGNILHGTGWMIGVGGAALYSIVRGQGDLNRANGIFTFTVKLAAIVATIVCLLLLVFNEPILYFFGASGQTIGLAQEYFIIHAFYGPFFIIANTFVSFVRNDNNPRLATMALMSGAFSNIILDYIYIYWFNWGMAGASFATILSPAITLAVLTLHLNYTKRKLAFAPFRFHLDRLRRIFSIGFSSLLNELASGMIIVFFNQAMLVLVGDVGVSAYAVVANINLVALLIFQGMGQGVQPLISRYYGMTRGQTVKRLVKFSILAIALVGGVLMTINLSFTDQIVSLFNRNDNPEMAMLASQGIRFFSLSIILAGLNILAIYLFAAIERAFASMSISLLRSLILIPPIIFFLASQFGVEGAWATMIVVELITLVFTTSFALYYWRKSLAKQT